MPYFRLYAASGMTRIYADDVKICYAIDWNLVACGYHDCDFIWHE